MLSSTLASSGLISGQGASAVTKCCDDKRSSVRLMVIDHGHLNPLDDHLILPDLATDSHEFHIYDHR